MNMLAIEWDADDARRRHKHKASTIHGWLCKMRGTLLGNERVRREGRYEMKEARAIRTYRQQRSKQQQKKQAGGFSLFGLGGRSSSRRHAVTLPRGSRHRSGSQKKSSSALVPYAHRGQAKRQQSDRRRLLQGSDRKGSTGSRQRARAEPQRHRSQTRPQPPARRPTARR